MAQGEHKERYLRLLENRRYPTFRLYAEMANRKTDPRDGLRLGALTAMQWLRQRLGERAPEELVKAPEPERWRDAGDECLTPLYCNRGYVLDIVSIPEEGVWTLLVTEPDLGSDPGNQAQSRSAVPGRVFETNIGFHIVGDRLECGFQTVVSDPEGTPEAEVYRLAIIHKLIQNRDFGLKHVVPLGHKCTRLKTGRDLDMLLALLDSEDNQLPCVVFTQLTEAPPASQPAPEQLTPAKPKANAKKQVSDPPYDFAGFADRSVAYCHSFLLEQPLFERFPPGAALRGCAEASPPGTSRRSSRAASAARAASCNITRDAAPIRWIS